MRPAARAIALERIGILMRSAASLARSDPALSARHAAMARRISTRHRVRMPYDERSWFCRGCKSYMAPGSGCRVRVGRSRHRAVRATCLRCGTVRRRIIGP